MGVLACVDIDETDHFPIRETPGQEELYQCLILHARFTFPQTIFNLYNVYFARHSMNPIRNVRDLMAFTKFNSGPSLLLGALNMDPDNNAFQMLRDDGWIDLWPEFHPEDQGLTYYQGPQAVSRADYAWVNPELRPYVEGIDLLMQNHEKVMPSDHASLLVSLDLHTKARL